MQRTLLAVARTVERHRWWVLGTWLVIVALSVPFALRQSEDLTGSGFDVPGSGSDAVRRAIERQFPTVDQAQLAVVLMAREGRLPIAIKRMETRIAGVAEVAVPAAAKQRALRTAQSGVAVIALRVAVGEERAPDVASELRERLDVGEARGGVVAHVIGLGAFVDATPTCSSAISRPPRRSDSPPFS